MKNPTGERKNKLETTIIMTMSNQNRPASSCSWWQPSAAAMDLSTATDLTRVSISSTPNLYGTIAQQKSPKSTLAKAVEVYVQNPSMDTAARVYQLYRKQSLETMLFSTHYVSLVLKLLDTIAEHLLSITSSTAAPSSTTDQQQQLLELVYLSCKSTAIGYPSHAMGKLLQWLISSIVTSAVHGSSDDDTVLKLQLVVMAELLKLNAGVRIYTKEMKKIKEFYRSLTIFLNSTEDPELLVFSMTILARLVLTESLGAKLFSAKNVEQTLDLIFSVLDCSWHDTIPSGEVRKTSSLSTILNHKNLLQTVSVDLLCDLADRPEILSMLEKFPKMDPTIEFSSMTINLNGNVDQIEIAIHFLRSVIGLGHHFRRMVINALADQDVLYRVLQVALHPSKVVATLTTQLLLKVVGDDIRPLQRLFDNSTRMDRLNPIITGFFRCITEASIVTQSTETIEDLSISEEYLHSVGLGHLLARLSEFPVVRQVCVQTINFNQIATLIQAESTRIGSMDQQQFLHFYPRLSFNLVMLLSRLMGEPAMNEKTKRTLNQFLQSSEVSVVVGAGFFDRNDKEMVVETLLLLHQFLSDSGNKRFQAFSLAEGIVSFGQRLGETNENLQSTITSLEASIDAHVRTIEKLQTEIQQSLRLQDSMKAQQDLEFQELRNKFVDQMRQKEEAFLKTKDLYEAKLRELSAQCESMGQHMNKKVNALQQRDQLLQENRAKRGLLEEENNELKHKVQVLEIRLEEVAQSHSVAAEEMKIREKELDDLREGMASLSGEYTAQREELERVSDIAKKLEDELNDKTIATENTYKELVLLSKAHKALTDEKDELQKEMDSMRDELSSMESLNISIQSRLQEKKDVIDQLERKIARFDEAATIAQNALEDEREKRRAAYRDLDDFRKAHRKLESDIAMLEIRAAEQRLLLESKDSHLRKCEEEIRHLTNEVGKQAKLQALIHQLSSGADAQSLPASSFLARDS